MSDPTKAEAARVKEASADWLEAVNYQQEFHEEWADNYLFLYKFDHYDGESANTRDKRRVKPRGRQMASKHRHKLAQIMRQAFHITTRAVDQITDPQLAATARWILEYEVNDPAKNFRRKLRRAYSLAMGCGAGAIGLGCRYDLGPYPVITPYVMDPRCVTWTPGFQDPDDAETPEVWLEKWYPVDYVEAMKDYGWKNTKDPRPSLPQENVGKQAGAFDRLKPIAQGSNAGPSPGTVNTARMVRCVERWRRFDSTRANKNADPSMPNALPEPDRYMACPDCGFQDRSQDGRTLPPVAPQACQDPYCGGDLYRVDQEMPVDSMLAYPQGHRLTIFSPADGREFYDDAWPYSINGRPPRNVPVAFFRGYDVPLEPWGSSDTAWDWSLQVIANSVMRRGWEQMDRGGGVIITGGKLMKADGHTPFQFTNQPLTLAQYKGGGEPQVKFFQPEGLPSGFVPFKQSVDMDFSRDMGTGDVSISGDQLKGVQVGVIRSAQQSGEIPVDDQAEQFRETLTPLLGTWYDMKRAVMTERQIMRIRGPQGIDELHAMRGEDLPNVDVIVGAQPTWDEFDAERVQQVQQLLAAPPESIQLLAEVGNIPPEFVQKTQEVAAAVQQRQAMAQQQMQQQQVPGPIQKRMNGRANQPQMNGA